MRISKLQSVAIGFVFGLVLSVSSCSKKEESGSATSAPPPAESQPATTGAAPAQNPTDLNQTAFQARITEVQTLRTTDVEKAADALLALQKQRLTAQQAEAVAGQMRQFQANLSAGVASGDPRAIAAANKLRQSATVR